MYGEDSTPLLSDHIAGNPPQKPKTEPPHATPKYTIQNESGQPYLYVNSFWEMHDLNVPITDKDKNIVSTVKHYNSNIYNYNLHARFNQFDDSNMSRFRKYPY